MVCRVWLWAATVILIFRNADATTISFETTTTPATNPCEGSPCQNGGTCNANGNSYTCFCQPGFAGTNCEINIDECASNPCQNGATCHDMVNRFQCTCSSGWIGTLCNESPFNRASTSSSRYQIYGDDTARRITVPGSEGFSFGGISHRTIWVSTNGLVSFSKRYTAFSSSRFYSSFREVVIAPMWTDVDCRGGGLVNYVIYNYNRDGVFDKIQNDVNLYTSFRNFQVTWAVVIEWTNVRLYYYGNRPWQTATFQLVLATDFNTKASFAYFIYLDITWSWVYRRNFIVGYNNGITNPYNNLYSGSRSVLRLHTIRGNTRIQGQWLFQISERSFYITPAQKCLSWYFRELPYKNNYVFWSNRMQCPCNSWMARLDRGRLRYDWRTGCYIFRWWRPYTKTCCYGWWGQLERSYSRGGHLYRYHPWYWWYQRSYRTYDELPKQWCCRQSRLCRRFFELRPQGRCRWWMPFFIVFFWGDPHIESLDGKKYTFNGLGEYRLLEVRTDNYTADVQARTGIAVTNSSSGGANATVWTAVAFKDSDGGTFQVALNENKTKFEVYINGADKTAEFYEQGEDFDVTEDTVTASTTNGSLVISLKSEIAFTLKMGVKMLTVNTVINDKYRTKTKGLMGNYDENPNDDFTFPNETVISTNSTDREIFYFGQSWQVQPGRSIFNYSDGKSSDDYSFPDFIPLFEDEIDPAKRREAEAICGTEDKECIIDYVVTGDQSVAEDTKNVNIGAEIDHKVISNSAPNIFVNTTQLHISVGETVGLQFVGNDSDTTDTVSYVLFDTPSSGFTFNNVTGEASWTPSSLNPEDISIGAVDSTGATTAPVEIGIVLCDCGDHGDCDFDDVSDVDNETASNFSIASCDCHAGYEGDRCDSVITVCEENPCPEHTNCTDLPPDQQALFDRAYNCSSCPSGFELIDEKCSDIDECNTTNSCEQVCENTEGSYTCSCFTGYRLSGSVCEDINECIERINDCSQVCENIGGSFKCSCREGSTLQSDNKTCVADKGPCEALNRTCEHFCSNETGTPECFCPQGYALRSDLETCEDFDECAAGQRTCAQKCINSVGSFQCSCLRGYLLKSDKTSCEACEFPYYGENCTQECECGDHASSCNHVSGCICIAGWQSESCELNINECIENAAICNASRVCVDTLGSYECNCLDGYTQEADGTCTDIDECADIVNNECNLLTERCVNTGGSYSCLCKTGYAKEGNNCTDINECETSSHGCEQDCLNTVGSNNCLCKNGFLLNDDRKTCRKDTSESGLCAQITCSYGCRKINSTTAEVECFCQNGYKLATDGSTCIDRDECREGHTCSQVCVNTIGGYNCSCRDGFYLDNDGRTCTECDSVHWGPNCENECKCGIGMDICNSTTGCVCRSGWTETFCDTDVNECTSGILTCPANSKCQNNPGSASCVCNTGYIWNNATSSCDDINECTNSALRDSTVKYCTQICTNTQGSFLCDCNTGFHLDSDKVTCVDDNECTSRTHDCSQNCRNTQGSFVCSCDVGFLLDAIDSKTCHAKVNCSDTHSCSQKCRVENGIDKCYCNNGFTLAIDNTTCNNIDECALDPSPCQQVCQDNAGSFQCSCMNGYKLQTNAINCSECNEGQWGNSCSQNCTCVTENTGFCNKTSGYCSCLSGWNGTNCQTDIDECLTSPCQNDAECKNTNGSYLCKCNVGFIEKTNGDTVECKACDEGFWGNDCSNTCTCSKNTAHCSAFNGTCSCKTGFTGVKCTTDIDDCAGNPCSGTPNTVCQDLPNDYRCDCQSGYINNGSNVCVDVDECFDSALHNCTDARYCKNTEGSFMCSATNECINERLCATVITTTESQTSTSTATTTESPTTTESLTTAAATTTESQTTTSAPTTTKTSATTTLAISTTESPTTTSESATTTTTPATTSLTTTLATTTIGACVVGTEYNSITNTCDKCQRGYYRSNTNLAKCQECPTGKTTESEGSTNRAQCSTSASTFFIVIKINIDVKDVNLVNQKSESYKKLETDISNTLTALYRVKISGFLRVIILLIKKGSAIVDHEIVMQTSEKSLTEASEIIATLSKETLSIRNTSASVLEVIFGNKTYTSETNPCNARLYLDPCAYGYVCNKGSCERGSQLTGESQEDKELKLGLGIGLSMAVLAGIIAGITVYVCMKKKSKKSISIHSIHSDDLSDFEGSQYFSSTVPRRNLFGSKDGSNQFFRPHNVYRDPDFDRSKFSWDFLQRYIDPKEDFEIQRPQILEQRRELPSTRI